MSSDSDAIHSLDDHATIQVILPRRKSGQSEVDRESIEPVILNRALLQSLFHLPLATASKRLGLSATSIKKVCRKIGIIKWPYKSCRKRGSSCDSGSDKSSSTTLSSSSPVTNQTDEESDYTNEDIEEDDENEDDDEKEEEEEEEEEEVVREYVQCNMEPAYDRAIHPQVLNQRILLQQYQHRAVQSYLPADVALYDNTEDVRTAILVEDYAAKCGYGGGWVDHCNVGGIHLDNCAHNVRYYRAEEDDRYDFWSTEACFDSSA